MPNKSRWSTFAETGIAACCATFMLGNRFHEVCWQLRGMATAPEHLGRKLGSKVLSYGIQHLRWPIRVFWCNARVSVIPFYEKQGWESSGDEFEMPGVGLHRVMVNYPV